ncbi:unnamed protein product [Mytilus coruscus]|uniref:B box-type domain-containing protein n=1 Tax=Mytilus coruscus TaxID=42192 RepID=A0A6J7ZTI7_MYTCO|nr:unnamed protein product [Mytilus coruscus]
MAQAASNKCDICVSALGSRFCLDCEQYFCKNCEAFHKRQKLLKHHEFQSASDVIRKVKSKCTEHKEDFSFLCKSCNVPVCGTCVSDKHDGHRFIKLLDSILQLKEMNEQHLRKKVNEATKRMKKFEQGLASFDEKIECVVKAITDEGRKIKDMVDKHIDQMIASVKDQSQKEKDKLTKTIVKNKDVLKTGDILDNRSKDFYKTRNDDKLIHALQNVSDEIAKLQIADIPEFPIVQYTTKSTKDNDIKQLFGSFTIREVDTRSNELELVKKR